MAVSFHGWGLNFSVELRRVHGGELQKTQIMFLSAPLLLYAFRSVPGASEKLRIFSYSGVLRAHTDFPTSPTTK